MNITEKYIDFDSYKIYTKLFSNNSKILLLMGTGNAIGTRALYDYQLHDREGTIAEYLCNNGVDVLLMDAVGYGNSIGLKIGWDYNRNYYAKQIVEVAKTITPNYDKTIIFGYCSTTAQTLLSSLSGLFDKIIIHSPSIFFPEGDPEIFNSSNQQWVNKVKWWNGEPIPALYRHFLEKKSPKAMGMRRLKPGLYFGSTKLFIDNRITQTSEKLIPKSNLTPNITERIECVVNEFTNRSPESGGWFTQLHMTEDLYRYPVVFKNHGYDFNDNRIPEIFSIYGQYDVEYLAKSNGFTKFIKPKAETVIENSTHWSFMENNYVKTLTTILDYCKQ